MTIPNEQLDVLEQRFEVQEKLGEGAFAETFLAFDNATKKTVVVKSLRVDKIDGWKLFELFEREANVLKSIEHDAVPHFVSSFATEDETGRPKFHVVMEHIEGQSLLERIETGTLSPEGMAQMFVGLLRVLEYLHALTPPLFHRDIKPSNILIRPNGEPVLIDFGSVCFGWREEDEAGSTITGTLGYMPPEQYLGQVSPRSDLYSLGATFLHVVTGRPPKDFSFEDGRLSVPDDLQIPDHVRRLINKLLETAPKDRPATATDALTLFNKRETALVVAPSTAISTAIDGGVDPLGGAPVFVDMGSPVRDPNGEFADIYVALTPPRWSLDSDLSYPNTKESWQSKVVWFFLSVGLAVFDQHRRLRKRNDRLFRHGEFAKGVVIATSNVITYEFEVGGETIRGYGRVAGPRLANTLLGAHVGVLYDPSDPSDNQIVFR